MLLIDRKMPKSCIDCVCNNDNYWCNMTGEELDYDIAWTGRMPNCPLKEQEHKKGKWIIRETAFEDTEAKCSVCGFVTLVNEPGNGLHMVSDLNFCPKCGSFNVSDMGGEQGEAD